MTSIVELFPKCRKLAYDSRQQLAQVQNGLIYPSELYLSLDELARQLDIMEELVLRETPAQREVWKRKILELREDARNLRRLGEDHDRKSSANLRHQRERDELLRRRRTTTSTNTNQNTDERDMEHLADEGKSLQQSHFMVNDLLGSGEASLNALIEQKQKLGGITGMLMTIGNRLNLSQSTMRIIERRDITDAYLVLGGMVVTCIVLYLVWFVEW